MITAQQRGFTLLELMTVMTIASLVMLFALPAYRRWHIHNQITVSVHELITTLNLARSLAVSRGHDIHVCASSDRQRCHDQKNWQDGWIIYQRQSGQDKPDILQAYRGPTNAIQIRGNGQQALKFTANGFAMIGRSFHVTHPQSSYRYIITVASTGRVATRRDIPNQ